MNNNFNNLIEKLKLKVMTNEYSNFLTSIMFTCNFKQVQDPEIPLAATDGKNIYINPNLFNESPENQIGVLLHELWHIARLHSFRENGRDHDLWNQACDIVINNVLIDDCGFFNLQNIGIYNPNLKNRFEEEIYDILLEEKKNNSRFFNDMWNIYNGKELKGDIKVDSLSGLDKNQTIKTIKEITDKIDDRNLNRNSNKWSLDSLILTTKKLVANNATNRIVWTKLLNRLLNETIKDYNFKNTIPNRRYDFYLPSNFYNKPTINISVGLDVSGSIDRETLNRFNAAWHNLFDQLNPKKLDIYTFNTKIVKELHLTSETGYKNLDSNIGGGTCYSDLFNTFNRTKPNIIVIFTDLYVESLPKLNYNPKVFWIVPSNYDEKIKQQIDELPNHHIIIGEL